MEPVLIYTDGNHVDVGAVQSFSMDMAFGSDEQDFEITFSEPKLSGGELVYIDGTEYGGVVDSIRQATDSQATTYCGRTWHGMLAAKVVKPPSGQDYYVASGDANSCISAMLSYVALEGVLTARQAASGMNVSNYQLPRFCNAYEALVRILGSVGAKLVIQRHDGITELWAEAVSVIEDRADSDLMQFEMTENHRVPNHIVAAGQGELQDRAVVDLYADASGNVSTSQTFFGVDEITVFYDYSGAEADELASEGAEELRGYQSSGGAEIKALATGDWYVGDRLQVRDNRTGTVVTSTIAKKIVTVSMGVLSVDYEVGANPSVQPYSPTVSGISESIGNPSTPPVPQTAAAHAVYAGPTSGGSGPVSFRQLVADDIPALPYAGSPSSGGNADRTNAILHGTVDTTSTSTAFTATVAGITALTDGTAVYLTNGVVTSAAGFTLNINGLGAKPVYTNMAAATAETTKFNVNYTMLFIYNASRVSGGCWDIYNGYDSNTNTIGFQLRTNSGTRPAADKGYRYRLWFTSADGTKWVPANTSTATNATAARTLNTRPIDPFGAIAYNGQNATTNAGDNLTTAYMWRQYTLTIGYSYMQSGFSLTFPSPVYLKAAPQSDGSAVMEAIVQALPSSADGKIYIYLGTAYSATAMELEAHHPVYQYRHGALRLYTAGEGLYVGDESLPDTVSGLANPDKNILVDNSAMTIQANLLTAAQTAALLS